MLCLALRPAGVGVDRLLYPSYTFSPARLPRSIAVRGSDPTVFSYQPVPTPSCCIDVVIDEMGHAPMLHHKEANKKPGSYIYRLPQVPLDVEGYSIAPAGLELEQVHVFVRHGERAPVGVRLANSPANLPPHWIMCKTARRFQAAVAKTTHMHQIRRVVERRDGTAVDGECMLGELTDVGKQSTYNFGVALRELYVYRLGFIPDILKDDRNVYFRSTKVPRTMESLLQIMHGLYPEEKCHTHKYPALLVRNPKDENLIGNPNSCKRLEILLSNFAKAAAYKYDPMLKRLDKHVSKYFDGRSICVDGKPKASGVMDTIRAAIAHGVKVPPEFEDKNIVNSIEEAVVQEWFSDKAEEVRRLAMGRLLDDLTGKMHRKMEREHREPKLLVHSTHDAAIAGLCTTLDVSEEKWPAFTASITFELFKHRASHESLPLTHQGLLTKLNSDALPTDYYIRMRFQNKNMILPICAERGKHLEGAPEFCTFKAFNDRVKELVPEDWEAECMPRGRATRS